MISNLAIRSPQPLEEVVGPELVGRLGPGARDFDTEANGKAPGRSFRDDQL
jgi:hypothetical protein